MQRARLGYEIWDLQSGNLVGDYDRREDAREAVRKNVRSHGPAVLKVAASGRRDATEKIGTQRPR